MKKVFYVLFASAAFSIVACKSGGNKNSMSDSTEMNNMANEAKSSVDTMKQNMADTSKKMMADTTKK